VECGGHDIEVLTRYRISDLIEDLDCEVNLHAPWESAQHPFIPL
jgi:hypothetical protein